MRKGNMVKMVNDTCRISIAVSVTTKIVKHANAVISVVQNPTTAAFVFSGTALRIHATAHIEMERPACAAQQSATRHKIDGAGEHKRLSTVKSDVKTI